MAEINFSSNLHIQLQKLRRCHAEEQKVETFLFCLLHTFPHAIRLVSISSETNTNAERRKNRSEKERKKENHIDLSLIVVVVLLRNNP